MFKGRKLAPKLNVESSIGRRLYKTHAEDALRLLNNGSAKLLEGKGRATALRLIQTPLGKIGPATEITLRSYQGAGTVYKEKLGPKDGYEGHWTYALKPQEAPLSSLETAMGYEVPA